jgi:hypothetical protein
MAITPINQRPVNIGSIPNDGTGDYIRDGFDKSNKTFADVAAKLNGIDDGAQVNPTPAVTKSQYEANANTNAYTDAEKAKLAGIATGAQVNAVTSVNTKTGAVVLTTADIADTNDKRYLTQNERTKIASVETGAQVNPTPAVTKTQYESNANTNAYTDAEKAKLGGIAAGAQVNTVSLVHGRTGNVVAAAGDYSSALISFATGVSGVVGSDVQAALTWLAANKTRSFDATTGTTVASANQDWSLPSNTANGPLDHFMLGSWPNGPGGSAYYYVLNFTSGSTSTLQLAIPYHTQGGSFVYRTRVSTINGGSWSTWNKIWTSASMGTGSGLDADMIGGINLAGLDGRYAATNHGHIEASSSNAGFMSATNFSKLQGIASGAQVNTVTSVNTKTGAVSLNTGDLTEAQDKRFVTNAQLVNIAALGSAAFANISKVSFVYRAINNLSGGGVISVSSNGTVSWSSRFIQINDNNTTGGIIGTFNTDFNMPPAGTNIPIVATSPQQFVTVNSNGIPLADWDVLYGDLATATYSIVRLGVSGTVSLPYTAIPIVSHNADNGIYKFGTAIRILKGQTINTTNHNSLNVGNAESLGFQPPSYYTDIVGRLGYTPVQQLGANKVYISWSGTRLQAQVDGLFLGALWTELGDGHNSGLDADTLDGLHGDNYLKMFTDNVQRTNDGVARFNFVGGGSTILYGTGQNVFNVQRSSDSANMMIVNSDGIVLANGFNNLSDRKLKKNIKTVASTTSYDIVKQLVPTTYKFKTGTRTHVGLIAQDVNEVCSDIVHMSDDSASIDSYGLLTHAIGAIKELQLRVEQLQLEIETLKSRP